MAGGPSPTSCRTPGDTHGTPIGRYSYGSPRGSSGAAKDGNQRRTSGPGPAEPSSTCRRTKLTVLGDLRKKNERSRGPSPSSKLGRRVRRLRVSRRATVVAVLLRSIVGGRAARVIARNDVPMLDCRARERGCASITARNNSTWNYRAGRPQQSQTPP